MIVQVILAAGASTRMGRPKPLLPFDGQPLLTRMIGEATQSRVDRIVVVLGHDAEKIQREASTDGATIVINDDHADGQTGSLQAAVRSLPAEAEALVNLPVDYPGVTRAEIDVVVDAFRRQPLPARHSIVTTLHAGRRGRPTLFARRHFDEILALRADEPARSLLDRHEQQILEVAVDNAHVLRDMDTPDDYRFWTAAIGREGSDRRQPRKESGS